MGFGALLRRERLKRHLLQRHLAANAGCSPALLSHIEKGKELPSQDLARKIITVLGLSRKVQKELLNALEADRQGLRRLQKPRYGFGEEFSSLLGKLGLSPDGFARTIARPLPTVWYWLHGARLPGSETVAEILIALRAAGAGTEDLRRLKTSHLLDLLTKTVAVSYLTRNEQMTVIRSLVSTLGGSTAADTVPV